MPTSFSKSPYAGTSYSGADMMATISIKNTDRHKNATCVLGELQTLSYSTHMERGSVRKLGNVNASDFTNGPRTIAGSLVFAVFNRHMIQPMLDEMGVTEEILPDELPPFDITITFANEYGHSSVLRIYGVRLVNEGEVLSTNDVFIENTYQYVAQNIQMLKSEDLLSISQNDSNVNNNSDLEPSSDEQIVNKDDLLDLNFDIQINDNEKETISCLLVNVAPNGYVNFSVEQPQPNLNIFVNKGSALEKNYKVPDGGIPFNVKFYQGSYSATLERSDGVTYNTVNFDVSQSKPSAPYVTSVTSRTIQGKVVDTNILNISYMGDDGKTRITPVSSQSFMISGLTPNTEYLLMANDENGLLSNVISTKTLAESSNTYNDFVKFTNYNNLNNKETLDFISKAEQLDKSFIESLYETYEKERSTRNVFNLNSVMHIGTYFDLTVKQKDYRFNFANKWLGDIRATKESTGFRVYSQTGISQTSQKAEGILKYQHMFQQSLEKLTTYKSSNNYQHDLQTRYLEKCKLNASMNSAYCARYGMMSIDTTYDYFDYGLSSSGAYIEIVGEHHIKGHHRTDNAYLVFKEDLAVDIVFKVKANTIIDYTQLDFYDSRNDYIVYLEYNNKPISKSIRIKQNKAEYAHGTLLSYALDRKMQDFIKELCIDQMDLFEMFCMGFYLLVNRKKLTSDYIKYFDDIFYSYQKDNRVKFYIEDRYLCFDKHVDLLLFDNQGNYLETLYDNKVLIKHSGYLVWSTPDNKADCLNFENI